MGKFIQHSVCSNCGSSDANSQYEDGSWWCFSCHTYTRKEGDNHMAESVAKAIQNNTITTQQGSFEAITTRGITLETCKKYNVTINKDETGQVSHHNYPYYDKNNKLSAYKVRDVQKKDFRTTGSWPITSLFGQQLFSSPSKYITICEGELDALAAHQMLGNYPVVSIRNGAGSALKDCKRSLEFLDSFENVVICFDSDKVGMKASQDVADLFSPGKCHILTTALKDPCEYLVANKSKQFVSEWFNNKKQYTPEGFSTGGAMFLAKDELIIYQEIELHL